MTNPLRIDGADISHWQGGDLDFAAAKKAGVQFVYHKASEDADYTDPNYAKRRAEAKKAGLPFGAYHFARPQSNKDAVAEARWFIKHADPQSGDVRPVLDLETLEKMSGMPLVRWADDFCAEVERLIGVVPICYTPYELSTELEKKTLFWRPRYNDRNEPPALPYDIWQFSNGKYGVPNKVAGLGHVDLNHMRDGLSIEDMLIPAPKAEADPDRMNPKAYFIGAHGPHVTWLGERLVAHGFSKHYEEGPGPTFSEADRLNVQDFQLAQGWKGKQKGGDADGFPGPDTLTLLAAPVAKPEPKPAPKPKPKPKPKPEQAKPARLRFGHASLQFSDSPAQHTDDIERLFARGYDVLTGTEAGPGAKNTSAELKRCARKYGYRLNCPGRYDTWVAVKGSLIKDGWDTGAEFALWRSSKTPGSHPGRWGDKGVIWASWNMGDTFGHFAVGAIHTLTHGGAGKEWKAESDKIYAEVIGKWAGEHGASKNLAFIGGDFNLVDRRNDLFHGQPLTSCWDDLKAYPNTGHGNIDAIARYDSDSRVRCVGARALNDKQVFLNTDHFLIEAEYEISPL